MGIESLGRPEELNIKSITMPEKLEHGYYFDASRIDPNTWEYCEKVIEKTRPDEQSNKDSIWQTFIYKFINPEKCEKLKRTKFDDFDKRKLTENIERYFRTESYNLALWTAAYAKMFYNFDIPPAVDLMTIKKSIVKVLNSEGESIAEPLRSALILSFAFGVSIESNEMSEKFWKRVSDREFDQLYYLKALFPDKYYSVVEVSREDKAIERAEGIFENTNGKISSISLDRSWLINSIFKLTLYSAEKVEIKNGNLILKMPERNEFRESTTIPESRRF